jgi:transposase-like protein
MVGRDDDARTAEVHAELEAAAGASRGRGRGYGAEARASAVEHARRLIASGWSVARVAKALGIYAVTLKGWMRAASDAGPSVPFAAVRVCEAPSRTPAGLSLVLPSGARVEGLDVTSAAALVHALQ